MFKLCFILLIVTLSSLPHLSNADCCASTAIDFTPHRKTCDHFGAFPTRNGKHCELTICGDGEATRDDYFCGKGACNFFGCKCSGGCIPGDAIENFKSIHGNTVSDVYRVESFK